MKVLSFRAQAVDHYRRAQRNGSMVKKKIKEGQWVRGQVARMDQMPGGIHVVYMTVEEFEGSFEAERLPPGFYYGNLPAVTIGMPGNRIMEFTCHEESIKIFPIGRTIRVDSNLTTEGKIEGVIVKTCRESNTLKPYWRITVECPPPDLRFEHYAIRQGDTINLNYQSPYRHDRDFGIDSNCFVKPQLESVQFKVPEKYLSGFHALLCHNKKVCIRLEDNSKDVSGFVRRIFDSNKVEVGICEVNQERPAWATFDQELWKQVDDRMSRTYGRSPAKDARDWIEGADRLLEYTMGIKRSGEMSFPLNFNGEDTMKIFEAVVVKLDDKGTFESVAAVIPPFVAKDETAAKNAVLVDYAQEKGLAGKDLTGFTVVVRNFQSAY